MNFEENVFLNFEPKYFAVANYVGMGFANCIIGAPLAFAIRQEWSTLLRVEISITLLIIILSIFTLFLRVRARIVFVYLSVASLALLAFMFFFILAYGSRHISFEQSLTAALTITLSTFIFCRLAFVEKYAFYKNHEKLESLGFISYKSKSLIFSHAFMAYPYYGPYPNKVPTGLPSRTKTNNTALILGIFFAKIIIIGYGVLSQSTTGFVFALATFLFIFYASHIFWQSLYIHNMIRSIERTKSKLYI